MITQIISKAKTQPRPQVVHLGVLGDIPGGIAQVVNGYLSWKSPKFSIEGLRTTKGVGDRLSFVRALLALPRFARLMARTRHTLFVAHLSQGGSFIREGAFLWIASSFGYPSAAQLHGSRFVEFAERRPKLTYKILSSADTIFVLTEATQAAVEKIFLANGRTDFTILRINNTVSVPELKQCEKTKTVTMAGELGKRKGVDVLLEAWSNLGDEKTGWVLELVGPFTDESSVNQQDLSVRVIGVEPHENLMTRLESSAIAVLVARDEALPMFLLEAMARRCAVLTTSVGQIPELVGRDGGLIVPVGDVGATTQALLELIRSAELRDSFGTNGLNRIHRQYSAKVMQPIIEKEWARLLELR